MKGFMGASFDRGCIGNQKGAGAYSFLGFLIIAIVIVGGAVYFPWEVFKDGKDSELASAKQALARKQWDSAISYYSRAIKANPAEVSAYLGRSTAYLQKGDLEKALKDANTFIEKKPDAAQGFGQRGLVNKVLGKNDEALNDFSKAVKIDGGYAWAYAQRADLYSRQKDQNQALEDATRAIQAKPNFVEALRLRAWILSRDGKCKEAWEDFKKVEELSPKDALSLQDKAWFLMTCPDEKLQDTGQAMTLAKKAMDLSGGKDPVVLETLAEAHFRNNDPAKAAELQRKAVEIAGKRCPDGSCTKEMQERLQKYELASRQEVRTGYEVLPMDSNN